ncbi:MAG: YecA family protein [Plesiomonas sp.]|uniref:YecA/YgfB family protein n=1 Tax=Plesiomonas sp. TaxID=2486279 RepID=UPI003EE4CC65
MNTTAISDYPTFCATLMSQGIAISAAELHGLLSGFLCGGIKDDSWKASLYDLTNEGQAYPSVLFQQVQAMQLNIKQTLNDDEFGFDLFLPSDDESVFDRVDALAEWVSQFLVGLGIAQPDLKKTPDEVGEVIDDLVNISQLGYDEEEDQEELAQSLEEVAEYVRMAAMLCFNAFAEQPLAGENSKPTLH